MVISSGTSRALLRFLRFLVVGGVNTLASYLVFCGCIWIGLHFTLATLVSYGVGVLIGFKMHGRFVFEHPGAHRFVQFAFISIVLLGCSLGMQALARHWVNDYLSGALAACITIPVSFFLNRAFVFHAPAGPDQEG